MSQISWGNEFFGNFALVVLPFSREVGFVDFQVGQMLCSKKKFPALEAKLSCCQGKIFSQAHGKSIHNLPFEPNGHFFSIQLTLFIIVLFELLCQVISQVDY